MFNYNLGIALSFKSPSISVTIDGLRYTPSKQAKFQFRYSYTRYTFKTPEIFANLENIL